MGDANVEAQVQRNGNQDVAYPESLEELQQVYKIWATTYDQDMIDRSDVSNETMAAASLDYIKNDESTLMLDVGAGTGRTAQFYKAAGFRGCIDAIDMNQEMLELAKKKGLYRKAYLQKLTAHDSLPVDDGTYDVVTAGSALMVNHMDPKCLRPMLNALKTGGLLIYISRTSKGNEEYLKSLMEIGKTLEKEGKMELLKTEEIPYHKTEITALIFIYKKN